MSAKRKGGSVSLRNRPRIASLFVKLLPYILYHESAEKSIENNARARALFRLVFNLNSTTKKETSEKVRKYMSNQNPKINNSSLEDRPSRPVRLSFREAFRRAASQVELHVCTDFFEKKHLRELCYIIAEVYIIDPDSKIKISDEILDAYLVQEIFRELTFEHLQLVNDNFKDQTELVKNKRAYLRTALYNSVFEFEAHYTNLVNHDMATGKL